MPTINYQIGIALIEGQTFEFLNNNIINHYTIFLDGLKGPLNKIWSDRKIKIANAIEKIYTHYIQLNRSCKCIFDNELLKDCNRKLLLVHIYTYTCKYLMKNEVNYIVSCTLLIVSQYRKKYHSFLLTQIVFKNYKFYIRIETLKIRPQSSLFLGRH